MPDEVEQTKDNGKKSESIPQPFTAENHPLNDLNKTKPSDQRTKDSNEGETREVATQAVLDSSSNLTDAKARLVGGPELSAAAAIAEFIEKNAVDVNGLSQTKMLQVAFGKLRSPDLPHTPAALEAMLAYSLNGGDMAKLDASRVNIALNLYGQAGPNAVKPHIVEFAANLGPTRMNGPLDVKQLERMAMPYAIGQVTDYRQAPIVGALVEYGLPVSRESIQAGVAVAAINDGRVVPEQVAALNRIGPLLKQPASSLAVLETFARAHAAEMNIDHEKMPVGELLSQLSTIDNAQGKISAANIAREINRLQLLGGGFTDHQLQDPATVSLLLEHGNQHPFAPQAVNILTRVVGSEELSRRPEMLGVVQEYLDNGGNMRDINHATLNAALALQETRRDALFGANPNPGWNDVRITSETIRTIQRDPNYSIADGSIRDQKLQSKILEIASQDQLARAESAVEIPLQVAEAIYESVPAAIKAEVPAGFSADVMDALSEALEANRGKWSAERCNAVETLLRQYGDGQPGAVKSVNGELARASASHQQNSGGYDADALSRVSEVRQPKLEIVSNGTSIIEPSDVNRISGSVTERFSTAALAPEIQVPQITIETVSSPDGFRFIDSIPAGQLSIASVTERMNGIDKEIAQANASGNADYARELKSLKTEYQSKSPAEREAYCREIHERAAGTRQTAHANSRNSLRDISSKAGTAGALFMMTNLALQITTPKNQSKTAGPRVLPSKD